MQSAPLITIIIPIYRAEAYLAHCVNSILAQSHSNLELILIDDGSPDGCPALCDAYAASDSRVKVVHQENRGVSAARNRGLDAAHGTYISFVDADDWLEPDCLAYLLGLLENCCDLIAACNHFVTVKGKDIPKFPVEHASRSLEKKEAYDNLLYHQPPDVSAWAKLYHRSLFEPLRYPEGRIFEDTWLIADLLESAGSLVYGGEPKYHYLYHQNTLSKNASREHMWDYLDAVDHLSCVILRTYPQLLPGCTRRRVHAALSIRRLLVHSDASAEEDLACCRSIIRSSAREVLHDMRVPFRDKVGIVLALAGNRVFDSVWGLYDKMRSKY